MYPPSTSTRRQFLTAAGALCAGLATSRGLADEAPIPTILERLRRDMESAPLEMRFRGGTAAECRAWQASFGARLHALLGPHSPPRRWKAIPQRSASRSMRLPPSRIGPLLSSPDAFTVGGRNVPLASAEVSTAPRAARPDQAAGTTVISSVEGSG